jgi:hypothetical protein
LFFQKGIILRNRLTTRKSDRDKLDIPGVYCIPYKDCKNSYIGQTGRAISTRLDEHRRRSTRVNSTISSAVKDLALVFNHAIDFNNVTALYVSSSVRPTFVRDCVTNKIL